MRRYPTFAGVAAAVVAAALAAGGGASAFQARAARTATLKFFAKTTAISITDASGKQVRNPARGDQLFESVDLYPGTARHHAAQWTGSAFIYCGITKVVSSSNIQATCDGVLAVGGSMLTSISLQNVAAQSNVYPIDGGTGKYVHVKPGSSVKTSSAGNNGAVVIVTIKL